MSESVSTEVVLPNLGITVERGKIVSWLKKPGDFVRKGEILFVVETDKVTTEVESPATGVLRKILVPEGVEVPILTVVALIADEGEDLPEENEAPSPEKPVPSEERAPDPKAETGPQKAVAAPPPDEGSLRAMPAARKLALERGMDLRGIPGTGPGGMIRVRDVEQAFAKAGSLHAPKASPLARAVAKVHGVDLSSLEGSGPGGKILKQDVVKSMEQAPLPDVQKEAKAGGGFRRQPVQVIPIRGVRGAIARNMMESLSRSAQFTLHTEALADNLKGLRERLCRDGGKISYNAILLKIAALALRRHPMLNASVEEDRICVWEQIHIGLAMETEEGLIVPVLRDPDQKTIGRIEEEITDLLQRVKEKRLTADDLSLGTFTLSNLGPFDIDFFTPILRPPESAILGIGRMVSAWALKDGKVLPETRMGLSLTIDHRIIDGAPGARFLKTVKELIEDPLMLLQ